MAMKCNFKKFLKPQYLFLLVLIALVTYLFINRVILKSTLESLDTKIAPVNIYGIGRSGTTNFGSPFAWYSPGDEAGRNVRPQWFRVGYNLRRQAGAGSWGSRIRYKNGKLYIIGSNNNVRRVGTPPQIIYSAEEPASDFPGMSPTNNLRARESAVRDTRFAAITPEWPHNSLRDLQIGDDGYVYVVSGVGRVFRSNGGAWERVTGGRQQISWLGITPTRYIGIGNGARALWSWNRNDGPDGEWKHLSRWSHNNLIDLAVNGEDIYVVSGVNRVFKYNGSNNWQRLTEGSVTNIEIYGDQIYGRGTNGRIYRHNLTSGPNPANSPGGWNAISTNGWVWNVAVAPAKVQREPQVGDRGREQRAEYRAANPINEDDVSVMTNYSILNKQIKIPPVPPAPPKSLDTPEVCQFFDLPLSVIKSNDRFSGATDDQISGIRIEAQQGCQSYRSQAICGQNPFCSWGNAEPTAENIVGGGGGARERWAQFFGQRGDRGQGGSAGDIGTHSHPQKYDGHDHTGDAKHQHPKDGNPNETCWWTAEEKADTMARWSANPQTFLTWMQTKFQPILQSRGCPPNVLGENIQIRG